MKYTILPADDQPAPETLDVELEAANNRIDDLEAELADRGHIVEVSTGIGTVKMTADNLRLIHEIEEFGQALATKYNGRVI